MKKFSLRTSSFLLAVIMILTSFSFVSFAEPEVKTYTSISESDALYTEGTKLYNRRGEEVRLRGINLGGWLIMEDWFCPVNNNKSGDLVTIETLTNRFGAEKTRELYDIYQDNWIVESDFKNIADMGFNCVRIPFWYRNFQSDDNGTWIKDENGEIDLSRLEWAVEMCRKYGIYAILDLHGANGCQGYADHCGRRSSGLSDMHYHFFDRNSKGEWYREQAVELWKVIAKRFAYDPAVAMFDLLNEPMCNDPFLAARYTYTWDFYDKCYDAIRNIDSTRILCMIGSWAVSRLPDPKKYGWNGVVYQYHQYDKRLSDYTSRIKAGWNMNYNVPLYAGEFHPNSDEVTLSQAIEAYDSSNMSWCLWTYKGYNSWAKWADWFAYGSDSDALIINAETDSYETIAEKWGEAMQTNSGNFHTANLYDHARSFLSNAKTDSVPFNTQSDIDAAEFVTVDYSGEYHYSDKYGKIPFLDNIKAFIKRIIDFLEKLTEIYADA